MNFKLHHSTAPWRVSGQPCYAGYKVVDSAGRSVAAFPSSSKRPDEERAGNAALIAAAPDLLSALVELVKVADGILTSSYSRDRIDSAKAAIAKATNPAPEL